MDILFYYNNLFKDVFVIFFMALPELLDVDKFFAGAPTCPIGRDVREQISYEEVLRVGPDSYALRTAQDRSYLGSKVVGAEGPL